MTMWSLISGPHRTMHSYKLYSFYFFFKLHLLYCHFWWQNRGTEKWSNFPKVTQLTGRSWIGKARLLLFRIPLGILYTAEYGITPLLLLFSHSVVSDSLWPHGLQHARLPCPSPSTGACWNSCPVAPFSSYPQSFPPSGSFPMSQLFASGGQSIGASAPASVLPVNIQGWFSLGLTSLILLSKDLSRVFSSTRIWKHQFISIQPSLWSNSHIRTWLLEKP